jgi:hypothetical protein
LKRIVETLSKVYFLCALRFNQTQLATLKTNDYLSAVTEWLVGCLIPESVRKTMNAHATLLPGTTAQGQPPDQARVVAVPSQTQIVSDSHNVVVSIFLRDLFQFLGSQLKDEELEISCSLTGIPLPFVIVKQHDLRMKR